VQNLHNRPQRPEERRIDDEEEALLLISLSLE
jgi:hypothetical protein